MNKNIALIDFGAGNLHSVYKAFSFIGANIEITKDPLVIEKASAVIFPGVGAFGSTMQSIRKNKLDEIITKSAKSLKPFLGICMGMQVLFDSSEEESGEKGLSVLKGRVVRFKKACKVPHIGWNQVNPLRKEFYFVHSYYVIPEDKSIVYTETEHEGERFVSAVKKENILAVQFHPEKSGDAGLEFLKDFVKRV
jgi:imidazole glycerol phosphate synthase glutamine amidotransferase subunit